MQTKPKRIKNILCVRNDRFGEFLLNIPALRALKETFEEARIIMVIDPYLEDLAGSVTLIDEVIKWGRGRHSLIQKAKLTCLLRRKKIDVAVMLNPSKEFNIFTYLAAIPIRAGYARKWDFLLTHKIEDIKHLGRMHEVDYNLELVRSIGAGTTDKTLTLSVYDGIIKDLVEQSGIKEGDTLIALHPWTSDPVKQWPLDNFAQLGKRLLKEKDIVLAIIGGKDEARREEGFINQLSGKNLVDLTGKTTLVQLAAFLKRCKLLISGDSGPVHLACSVNTRVLALFRNDLSGKTAQRWGPWGAGHVIIEKNSLSDISVDEVFNKAKEALDK